MERLLLGLSAIEPIEPAEHQGKSSRRVEEEGKEKAEYSSRTQSELRKEQLNE